MKTPTLSIIIPTLRAEMTLATSLESVLRQQYKDLEILIMDSVSQDSTLEIARTYESQDKRIRIWSEPDQGVYDAMNKGIAKALGEWILFLGSDDRLYDESVLASFFQTPDIEAFDMVYGNVVSPSYKGLYDGEFNLEKLLSRNLPHQAVFYRRSLFGLVGLYVVRYKGYADWDLNIRCFRDARVRIRYIDLLVAYFGAAGISSRHDVPFLREIMIPEQLRMLVHRPRRSRSIRIFDEWWRLLRNAGIRDKEMLVVCAAGQPVPRAVARMAAWQEKIPAGVLKSGVFSKIILFFNYISSFLTASL
jgi:glycosyltransferase involved in cell wall biosynthesis